MARLCHYSGKKGLLFSRPTGRSGLNIDFQRLSSETQGSAFNLIQQLRFRLCAIHFHYLNAVVCRQAYQALRLFLIGTIHFQAHLAPIHLRGGLRQLQMRKHRTVAHQHDYRQAACFNPVPSAFIHFLRLIVYPLSFGKVNGAAGYTAVADSPQPKIISSAVRVNTGLIRRALSLPLLMKLKGVYFTCVESASRKVTV